MCKHYAYLVNTCNQYNKVRASPSDLNENSLFMVETLSHKMINTSIRIAQSLNKGYWYVNMFWTNGSYHVERQDTGGEVEEDKHQEDEDEEDEEED